MYVCNRELLNIQETFGVIDEAIICCAGYKGFIGPKFANGANMQLGQIGQIRNLT